MSRQNPKSFPLNEYAVMQAVASNPGQTQRQISERIGLSLGMTNMLLMRLARKGYIKIRQLDWKRTEYLLTIKGALEKTRKSYSYTLHTIRLFQHIMESVQKLVQAEYAKGARRATVVAWPETQKVVSGAVAELGATDLQLDFVENFKSLGARPGLVFVATEETVPKPAADQRFVRLLDIEDLRFKFPE